MIVQPLMWEVDFIADLEDGLAILQEDDILSPPAVRN